MSAKPEGAADAGALRVIDRSLRSGVSLRCHEAGERGPRVMFLHGFPEAAFVWDELLLALAPQARAVAPNLRGYAGSSAPAEPAAYRAKHLVADVLGLIDAPAQGPLDLLVAHDWGGAVAWNLAAQFPQVLKRLLIINSPHPATFLRELRDNPAQQAASTYMNFLRRPDAGALLAENDYARLWPFFEQPAGATWLTPELKDRYRSAWAHGLQGPAAWYAASPLHPPTAASDPIHSLQFDDAQVTVNLPTTVLWGERDIALLPALLQGLERWLPQMRLLRVPDASHWMLHEQPALVRKVVRQELGLAEPG
jgi:epoxide hydrolase 4